MTYKATSYGRQCFNDEKALMRGKVFHYKIKLTLLIFEGKNLAPKKTVIREFLSGKIEALQKSHLLLRTFPGERVKSRSEKFLVIKNSSNHQQFQTYSWTRLSFSSIREYNLFLSSSYLMER